MRPEKCDRLVRNFIEQWLAQGKSRVKVIPALEKLYTKQCLNEQPYTCYKSGFETYGYDNKQSIQHNMLYISDRFRCSFRLRWLIDGIKSGHI